MVIAVVVPAVFFGLAHATNENVTWLSMFNIVIFGLLFGTGYVLTGELALPIGLHFGWDFVRSMAEHIAAVGRLPLVHALTISGPPPAVDAASAVRAKDLLYCTTLAPGVSFTGPVLLVDDTIRTRWTATVAAALLADAGATSVLPLAIHQLP